MRHAVALALVLAACTDNPPSGPAVTSNVEYHEWPANHPSMLDLLLVIDNTSAMAPYQTQVAQLPSIVDSVIARSYDGMPDVHVAVTTNGGAVSTVLSDQVGWDGTHTSSFQGTFADALAPLVAVGTSSAGPAQPLAAMKSAIEGTPGFSRDFAYLGIVTISPTDDASPAFDYVTWLKASKTDPADVVVSGIYPQPSATLDAFFNSFPNRSTVTSIDATDYSSAFGPFELMKTVLGVSCFTLPADVDPVTPGDQYDCDVSAWDDNGLELTRLPECDGGDPATGTCWEYTAGGPNCIEPGTGEFHLRGTWRRFHPAIRTQCVVK